MQTLALGHRLYASEKLLRLAAEESTCVRGVQSSSHEFQSIKSSKRNFEDRAASVNVYGNQPRRREKQYLTAYEVSVLPNSGWNGATTNYFKDFRHTECNLHVFVHDTQVSGVFFFLDDAPITQLLQAASIQIPLDAAADELIDLSGLLSISFALCRTKYRSVCMELCHLLRAYYGVTPACHDYLFVSGTDWHSRTHREDGIQVFSVVY